VLHSPRSCTSSRLRQRLVGSAPSGCCFLRVLSLNPLGHEAWLRLGLRFGLGLGIGIGIGLGLGLGIAGLRSLEQGLEQGL
jgi:hypothetical protein